MPADASGAARFDHYRRTLGVELPAKQSSEKLLRFSLIAAADLKMHHWIGHDVLSG